VRDWASRRGPEDDGVGYLLAGRIFSARWIRSPCRVTPNRARDTAAVMDPKVEAWPLYSRRIGFEVVLRTGNSWQWVGERRVRECRGEGRRERCRPGRSWPGSGEDGAAGMGNGRRGGAGRGIDLMEKNSLGTGRTLPLLRPLVGSWHVTPVHRSWSPPLSLSYRVPFLPACNSSQKKKYLFVTGAPADKDSAIDLHRPR
jgi:hypothetical protein